MTSSDRLPISEHWVLQVEEPGNRREYALPTGKPMHAGRSRDCDVRLTSESVSKHHCIFIGRTDGVELRNDERSKYPAMVDGRAMSKGGSMLLSSKSKVRLGETVLRIDRVRVSSEQTSGSGDEMRDEQTKIADVPYPARGASTHAVSPVVNEATDNTTGDTRRHMDAKMETMSAAGAPDHAGDSGMRTTGYVSEKMAREILEKPQRGKRNVLLISTAGVFLAFLTWQFLGKEPGGDRGDEGASATDAVYDGSFFVISLERDWKCDANGKAIVFSRGGVENQGIAILKTEASGCRWWNYEKAFDFHQDMVSEDMPSLTKFSWQIRKDHNAGQTGIEIRRTHDAAVPYVVFVGRLEKGATALCRVFLSGVTVVSVFAWDNSGKLSESVEHTLNSFQLKGVESDNITRVAEMEVEVRDMTITQATLLIDEGSRWFDKKAVAPGNAWKAYQCLLNAHQWFGSLPESEQVSHKDIMEKEWMLLTEVASFLDRFYWEQRALILSAVKANDQTRIRKLVNVVQNEIPDRRDHRWLWAEKQRSINAQERKKTGFLT